MEHVNRPGIGLNTGFIRYCNDADKWAIPIKGLPHGRYEFDFSTDCSKAGCRFAVNAYVVAPFYLRVNPRHDA